jgi:predicted methyltransferase
VKEALPPTNVDRTGARALSDQPARAVTYRLKLLIFLLAAIAVLFIFRVAYSALETISQLKIIEAQRDQWQRPSDVLRDLDLKAGNVVVDLGCGSGYFTLKLSSPVGGSGRVIAEDIRALPLAFLWIRAAGRREHNVKVVVGGIADPHLPNNVDAVLISNTYHEFADAHSILVHVHQSLAPGGRLVIIDREPKSTPGQAALNGEHEVSADQVQGALRETDFQIVSRDDHFIEHDPYGENWWLMVARKPGANGLARVTR